MLERITALLNIWWDHVATAILFAAIGVAIELGQILKTLGNPPPARVVFGRCISTAGLAVSAGAVLLWVPDLSRLGQIGIAAALASLGTSGLERVLLKAIDRRGGQ